MSNRLLALLLTTLFSFTLPAHADNGIKYNFVDLRYIVDVDIDDTDIDGDGLGFGGSFRLDELLYVVADYQDFDFDDNFDGSRLEVGIGAIFPYQKIDFVAELALVDDELDGPGVDESDTGFRISGGARTYIASNVELRGYITHIDVDDDDTFFTIAGDYFLTDNISVGAAKDISADTDRFSIGARFYF